MSGGTIVRGWETQNGSFAGESNHPSYTPPNNCAPYNVSTGASPPAAVAPAPPPPPHSCWQMNNDRAWQGYPPVRSGGVGSNGQSATNYNNPNPAEIELEAGMEGVSGGDNDRSRSSQWQPGANEGAAAPVRVINRPNAKFVDDGNGARRDRIWAILFIFHLIGLVVLGLVLHDHCRSLLSGTHPLIRRGDRNTIHLFIILACLTAGCSLFVLWLISRSTRGLMRLVMCVTPLVCVGIGGRMIRDVITGDTYGDWDLSFSESVMNMIVALLVVLVGLIVARWSSLLWIRTEWSGDIVNILGEAHNDLTNGMFRFLCVILGVIGVMLGWIAAWSVAVTGTLRLMDPYSYPPGSDRAHPLALTFIWIYLILSFHWTTMVFEKVMGATVAGIIGKWYFHPRNSIPSNVISSALYAAAVPHLGTISLASLVSTITNFYHLRLRRYLHGYYGTTWTGYGYVTLDEWDRMFKIFNVYTLPYVALHGNKPFMQSAQESFELINYHEQHMVTVDQVVSSTLVLIGLSFGVGFGLLSLDALDYGGSSLAGWVYWTEWSSWLLFIVAFALCYMVTQVVLAPLSHGTITFFLCYAEDKDQSATDEPEVLMKNHPSVYRQLKSLIQSYQRICPYRIIPDQSSGSAVHDGPGHVDHAADHRRIVTQPRRDWRHWTKDGQWKTPCD